MTIQVVRQNAQAFYTDLSQVRTRVYQLMWKIPDWTAVDVDALDAETVRVLEAWQAMTKVLVAYQQQEANDGNDCD